VRVLPIAVVVAVAVAGAGTAAFANDSLAIQTQGSVPNLSIVTGTLGPGQVGVPYQAVLQAAGGTAPLHWSAQGLPAGLAVDSASGTISGTPSAPGDFAPAIKLTDAYGSSVSQTFALGVKPGGIVPPPAPKVPRLTAWKQSSSRWLPGSKPASLASRPKPAITRAGVPVGTTFSFSLDRRARVSLTFRHTASGRSVSGTCVARAPRNAGNPVCTRTLTDGTLRVAAPAGRSYLHFESRISPLVEMKAGRYSVTSAATNAAGTLEPVQALRFTIAA
jgi:hypothetical protein